MRYIFTSTLLLLYTMHVYLALQGNVFNLLGASFLFIVLIILS